MLMKSDTTSSAKVLLIVGGGIAAYKACELIRLLRREGRDVTCVLTEGGAKFVTALTLAALSENPVHTTLWDLKNEIEMGHIQLSRAADLVVVCPATADLIVIAVPPGKGNGALNVALRAVKLAEGFEGSKPGETEQRLVQKVEELLELGLRTLRLFANGILQFIQIQA